MEDIEKMKQLRKPDELPETGEIAADAGQEEFPARMSWEEILADAEYRACYDAAVQAIVQKRLRKRHGAEACLERMQPLFEALALRYGGEAEPEKLDVESLTALVLRGLEKNIDDSEKLMAHLAGLMEQEAELKKLFPDFELMRELEDPGFLKLTAPHNGLSLADAYYALHRDEIGRAAAKQSLLALSRSIRSGGERPRELGDCRQGQSFSRHPGSMSRAQREALKKRIYDAGALGEKIFP